MILVITMDATSHSTIVNPFTVSHDRNRPLSKNSGHCLETHTGSHLEVEETDSPDKLYLIPQLPILLLFFMRAPSPLQQIQATVWKLMQDLSWKMLVQLRHPLWLK